MYIFGKFEAFQRRLMKILDLFQTIKLYSSLETSQIEGMEPMIGKYQVKDGPIHLSFYKQFVATILNFIRSYFLVLFI